MTPWTCPPLSHPAPRAPLRRPRPPSRALSPFADPYRTPCSPHGGQGVQTSTSTTCDGVGVITGAAHAQRRSRAITRAPTRTA